MQQLVLKIGAQVVLTVNRPSKKLVNGSRGVVVGLQKDFPVYADTESYGVPPGLYDVPVVRFDDGALHAVTPSSFFQGGGSSGALVRTQVPLRLAWALTVHKSQGMTLGRVELMLADAFEYGQAYVALSRATALAGLWLRGPPLTKHCVKAHPAATQFYEAAIVSSVPAGSGGHRAHMPSASGGSGGKKRVIPW
jgi:ATP-dependent DNA helicase PIF1